MLAWPLTVPEPSTLTIPQNAPLPATYWQALIAGRWPHEYWLATPEPTSDAIDGVAIHALAIPGARTIIDGLPDDWFPIAQDEAQKIAHDAILSQLKAEQAYLDGAGKINVYYDVTDSERPLWKFFFNTSNLAVYPEDSWGYFVSLDAYTGEIVKIYPREVGMDMIDLM